MDDSAVAALNRAFREHDLWVISAAEPEVLQKRKTNLAMHGFLIPNDRLIHDPDKVSRIVAMKPDLCIEDSPKNIKQLIRSGLRVAVPNQVAYAKKILWLYGEKPGPDRLFYYDKLEDVLN
jgi:hypothetical protein